MPIKFPIDTIRDEFQAMQRIENGHFVSYFDAPGGTQIAKSVVDAMGTYMKNGVANVGSVSPTSRETAVIVNNAREHAATLLGANKENIVFGANMTSLAFQISQTISKQWNENDTIVLSEMEHHANIDPWKIVAEENGVQVNTIPVDPDSKTLNYKNLNQLITENTKLVAIGLASNAIGTVNELGPIIKRAKEVGALIVIDAAHAVPYFSIDFHQLGVDVLFCSAYKFFGPHVGIAVVDSKLLNSLHPDKVDPAPYKGPEKLEVGTLNFEGLVGLTETIEFIASIGEGNLLREKIKSAYHKISLYEAYLAERLRKGLAKINFITLYQANEDVLKTPTVAFRVHGMEAKLACHYLAQDYAIHLEYGNFYAKTLMEKLGVPNGEVIRAGIAPYNTVEEIDKLIQAVADLESRIF